MPKATKVKDGLAVFLSREQLDMLVGCLEPSADAQPLIDRLCAARDSGEDVIDLTAEPPRCGHCGDRGVACPGCGGAE